MKKTLLLLTLLATLFTACDDDPLPGNDPSGGTAGYANYYNSNDLHKRQLKGAVKMIRTVRVVEKTGSYTDITDEFDTRGNIVKSTSFGIDESITGFSSQNTVPRQTMKNNIAVNRSVTADKSVTNYTYDAFGRLSGIYRHGVDTILLRYGNHGAYLPFEFIYSYDMKQNITQVIMKDGSDEFTNDYVLEGTELKSCHIHRSYNTDKVTYDTVIYKLNAGKMPVSCSSKWSEITYAYYPGNMLKEIKEEYAAFNEKINHKVTFVEDSTSLLVAGVEWVYESISYSDYAIFYIYNDRKDLQKIRYNNSESSYIYDAFDTNGNWTERTIGGNGVDGTFVAGEKEYRSIVYY